MISWRNIVLAGAIGAVFLASPVFPPSGRGLAAEPGTVTGRMELSLENAVSLAERNNETLLMALEDERQAGGVVREAWAGALPSIKVEGTYQRNFKKPVFFITSDSVTTKLEIGGDIETQGRLRLDQVLYTFGRVGNAVKFAGIYKDIASLGVENARSHVVFAVRETYYRVLLMGKAVDIQRQSLKQAQSRLKDVEDKYGQGTASRFDLLRAQVEVKNREPGVIEAENDLALSTEDLKRVVGLDRGSEPFLTDSLGYQPIGIGEDDAISEAVAHRPELVSLMLNVQGRKRLLAIEKAGMFPMLGLYGEIDLQGQSRKDDLLGSFGRGNRAISSSVGLALSAPIFDGLKTRARVTQARAALKRAEYELEQARKGIRLEVSKSVRDLASLRKEYESQVATVGLAEEAYRIAQARFRSGLSTQLELNDVQMALDFARTNFAQTLYEYNVAAANLERVLGRTSGGVREIERK
jgi:outer membrane protein